MEAELRGFQVADYVNAPRKERQDASVDDSSGRFIIEFFLVYLLIVAILTTQQLY